MEGQQMVGKTMKGVKSHGLMMYLLWNCSVVICLDSSGFAGINPADRQYYETDVIMCKDGSNHFTRARLNDDFCDCTDGTDEPGTSACAEGHFFCLNAHRGPTKIYSSQVNDGICDCCDGSDEHYFKVQCQNTCGKEENAFTEKLMQDMTKSVIIDVPTSNEMIIEDIRQKPRDLKGIAILEVVGIAFVLVCYWYYHNKRTYFRQRLSTSHPSTKSV